MGKSFPTRAISSMFSERCVWILRFFESDREPRADSNSGVQDTAERGVRIGATVEPLGSKDWI